jgi:transposase
MAAETADASEAGAEDPEVQQAQIEELRQLTRTDADPRVRRRAQAVLLVVEGRSVASVAALFHTAGHCVRTWRDRFASEGRTGLVDRPRRGRPPKLGAVEQTFLQEVLERDPADYGLPVTVWSIRDLQALLKREREVEVSVYTLHRVLHAMGYRYRRPRHDLTHRQDAEAVASMKQVLEWLRKKVGARLEMGPQSLPASAWSTSTSAKSTPTPGWFRSGDGAAAR